MQSFAVEPVLALLVRADLRLKISGLGVQDVGFKIHRVQGSELLF